MAFVLSMFMISAVLGARPLALRSESQVRYRAGLGAGERRATIGGVLIAVSWLVFLGTLTLGATSPEPLHGWVPVIGSCGFVVGVVCAMVGLQLRREDPERANLGSLVLLWGLFAVGPYVEDALPTMPTLVVGAVIIAVGLTVRLVRWRRRRTST